MAEDWAQKRTTKPAASTAVFVFGSRLLLLARRILRRGRGTHCPLPSPLRAPSRLPSHPHSPAGPSITTSASLRPHRQDSVGTPRFPGSAHGRRSGKALASGVPRGRADPAADRARTRGTAPVAGASCVPGLRSRRGIVAGGGCLGREAPGASLTALPGVWAGAGGTQSPPPSP